MPKGAGAYVRLGLGAFPDRAEETLTINNGDDAKNEEANALDEQADGHVGTILGEHEHINNSCRISTGPGIESAARPAQADHSEGLHRH